MFTAFLISVCLLLCTSVSSPQNLLLATDSGIKTLSISTLTVTTLHNQAATAVDFRYNSKDIYFISNSSSQIFYSYYSQYSQSLSVPVPRVTSLSPLSSLAVDWVSYRLYYGRPTTGSLIKETLRASTAEEVASKVVGLQNFALDPYKKLLFFTTDGRLYSVDLGDAAVNHHDLKGSGLTQVKKLALDLHTKEVYVVCQRESDGAWLLVVKDYSSSAQASSVYVGEELAEVRALAVYDGLLVWASPCGGAHCLYSCQLHTCHKDNLTIAWRTFEVINDVKFYSPLAQTPDDQTACQLCSHGCSSGTADCACPEDMEVEDSGVECRHKPPTWDERVMDLLDGLVDGCRQWFRSLTSTTGPYLYIGGGLVLTLLFCCLCLLTTLPCSKTVEDNDEYPMTEWHHPHCTRRQSHR